MQIKTILFDLDGVFVDLRTHLYTLAGRVLKGAEEAGSDLTGVLLERYFDRDPFLHAPPMPDFDDVVAWLRELQKTHNVEFLSGMSASNAEHARQTSVHKQAWLTAHGLGDIKLNLAVGMGNKMLFATPDHLLIDDNADLVESFRKAGGQGVIYRSLATARTDLDQQLAADGISPLVELRDKHKQPYYGLLVSCALAAFWEGILADRVGAEKAAEFIGYKAQRDKGHHHITIMNAHDVMYVKKHKIPHGQQFVLPRSPFVFNCVGLGAVAHSREPLQKAYFVVMNSPAADAWRAGLGLHKRDFHLTLGFDRQDVHFGQDKKPVRKDQVSFPLSATERLAWTAFKQGRATLFTPIEPENNPVLSRPIKLSPQKSACVR